MVDVVVRQVGREEWATASPMVARAFFDEEFVVAMLGSDPATRWEGVHRMYAEETFDDAALHLAAYVGDVVVGVVRASPTGACHVCTHVDPDSPPADPLQAQEWAFEVQVQKAHEGHDPHAWISRVAVEPALHGGGVGRVLVDAAVARLRPAPVLLECLASREPFYARCGFERVGEVVDPYADETYLMQLDAR